MGEINLKELNRHEKIIVYGAGEVSRVVVRNLRMGQGLDVLAIAVTSTKDNPCRILDVPVLPVQMLTDFCKNATVLVAVMEDKHCEIRETLSELGFLHVYFMRDADYEEMQKEGVDFAKQPTHWREPQYMETYWSFAIAEWMRKGLNDAEIRLRFFAERNEVRKDELHLGRIVTILGTKCSLRCKECCNIIPQFNPAYDFSLATILESLSVLVENVDDIQVCELIGGEPFLSSNLEFVLDWTIGQDKIKHIEITTNGTILPNERLIPLLQDEKVEVRISRYGAIVNPNRLIEFLDKHKVYYQILPLEKWISPGNTEKRNRSIDVLRKLYAQCGSGAMCKAIFDGKFFHCTRAASLFALGYMKEEEYVPLDKQFTAEVMRDFILRDYAKACDYCDFSCNPPAFVPLAEQLPR